MAELLPIGTRVRMLDISKFYHQCQLRGVIYEGEITRYSNMGNYEYVVKWDYENRPHGHFHYRSEHIEVIITTNRDSIKYLLKK
jgi:hypothetical protein